MQPPIKSLEEIRGYLDVNMQQFFLEYDAEDLVSEKGGIFHQQFMMSSFKIHF